MEYESLVCCVIGTLLFWYERTAINKQLWSSCVPSRMWKEWCHSVPWWSWECALMYSCIMRLGGLKMFPWRRMMCLFTFRFILHSETWLLTQCTHPEICLALMSVHSSERHVPSTSFLISCLDWVLLLPFYIIGWIYFIMILFIDPWNECKNKVDIYAHNRVSGEHFSLISTYFWKDYQN